MHYSIKTSPFRGDHDPSEVPIISAPDLFRQCTEYHFLFHVYDLLSFVGFFNKRERKNTPCTLYFTRKMENKSKMVNFFKLEKMRFIFALAIACKQISMEILK